MQILVCLRSSAKMSDCPALKEAISLRDALNDCSTVCAVSMGSPRAEAVLAECTACGADSAYLLNDSAFTGADTHATARVLQAFINKVVTGPFIVFTQESDAPAPTYVVPARLAGMLGTEQFYYVKVVSVDSEGITCSQDYGDSVRTCRVSDGSVIRMDFSETPASLSKIREPLEVVKMDRIALGLGMYSVGKAGSRTENISTGVQ